MNKVRLLKLVAASSVIFLGATATYAMAGEGGMGYSSPPTSSQPKEFNTTSKPSNTNKTMRAEIVNPLKDGVDLANKKDFQGALAKIKEADAVTDKSQLEEYNVAKILGYVSVQLHDYPTAAAAYHRTLASNAVPAEELPQILKAAFVLDANTKDYHSAISEGEQLQKLGPMDAPLMETLAQVYYFGGDYPNALKTAHATVDMESANGTPSMQSLEVLFDAQLKTKDQAGAKQTFAKMCSLPSAPSDCAAMKKH